MRSILSHPLSDGIYQTHPVEFTVRPLATVMKEGTTHIIAFQYKLRFPDWDNWVCHGCVCDHPTQDAHDPRYWQIGADLLENVGDDGVLPLEDQDTEIGMGLQTADMNHGTDDISIEVPLPPDSTKAILHLLYRTNGGVSPTSVDASSFTDAADISYGIQDGEALVGLTGDGDPHERTILGYHTGSEKRVYSGIIGGDNSQWEQVVVVNKTAGTGEDRPPHVTAALEEWLAKNYGDQPDARSDRTVVPLVPWEPSIPYVFPTAAESTLPSSRTASSGKATTQPSASSKTSSESKSDPLNDPGVEAFVDQLATETGVDRAQIIERYQEMKAYKVPEQEAKRATRATFTDRGNREATATSEGETDTSDSDATQDSPDRGGISGIFSWLRG